jgi:hypothetical protein
MRRKLSWLQERAWLKRGGSVPKAGEGLCILKKTRVKPGSAADEDATPIVKNGPESENHYAIRRRSLPNTLQ